VVAEIHSEHILVSGIGYPPRTGRDEASAGSDSGIDDRQVPYPTMSECDPSAHHSQHLSPSLSQERDSAKVALENDGRRTG
jgi:hypothetical protein